MLPSLSPALAAAVYARGPDRGSSLSAGASDVRAVAFAVNAAVGFAAKGSDLPYSGSGYKTTDGGASWTLLDLGLLGALWGASFVDDQTGYMVVSSGVVLRSTNGGGFSALVSGTSVALRAVAAVDAQTAYVAGDSGTLLKVSGGTTASSEGARLVLAIGKGGEKWHPTF